VVNLQGQRVSSGVLTGDNDRKSAVIDLSGNSRGVYFVKVVTGEATLVEKVVLQ
jgi:hypothetical protein